MSDSLSQKIAVGLRQLSEDMIGKVEQLEAERGKKVKGLSYIEAFGFACEAMQQYADRAAGYAAELEAEVASGEGVAGTHAYDMLAVAAEREVTTTEMLISMVAATVLMKGVRQFEHSDAKEVSFSPLDMDAMHRDYEMTATHDGLATTVRITPRSAPVLGLKAEPGPDDTPAKGQAPEHVFDKPYWFARIGPERIACDDRAAAEALVRKSLMTDESFVAEVENRMCPMADCPNPDTQGTCLRCEVH
jgi:hypothetical protein